jgi:hypothetical protein
MSTAVQTLRGSIWAISITAVTVMGAWYGAGLKVQKDHKEVCHTTFSSSACTVHLLTRANIQAIQKRRETPPAEIIAQLEVQKGALVAKRLGLEKKLHELELRNQGATREQSKEGMERKR